MDSVLTLADGRTFRGCGFGCREMAVGEVVFNTSMTGYQEILTDPSYCGQIVVMTQPLIGNYGVTAHDEENREGRIWAVGFVVREVAEHPSSHRAEGTLADYLGEHGTSGLEGVDTRALTRHLRSRGAMVGALAPADADPREVSEAIRAWGGMEGKNLLDRVTPRTPYTVPAEGTERFVVAAYDFGAKRSIFAKLARRGITVHAFPAGSPPDELMARGPDGIFLSNGPGDPAACSGAVAAVGELMGERPLFGICLGHQLIALAAGARTYKLPFGHHGGNHPVKDLESGRVEITAQNHGFAVEEGSLAACGAAITHVNLNDRSVEGFTLPEARAFAVQYHPEATPGPHDAEHHFDRFVKLLEEAS